MISHMRNLKYNPNEKCTKQRQTQRTDLQSPRERGWGRKWLRGWDEQMQTIIYRMGKQRGLSVIAQGTIRNILQ